MCQCAYSILCNLISKGLLLRFHYKTSQLETLVRDNVAITDCAVFHYQAEPPANTAPDGDHFQEARDRQGSACKGETKASTKFASCR